MAGMYPDDKEVEIYGEKVTFPGLNAEGKYTNGDFTNPAVKPSFFDAATSNLILDNLSELIEKNGFEPNNEDAGQVFQAVLAAVQNRDKPISDTGGVLTFASSGTVDLTKEATTRTLSSGLWVGQKVLIKNDTVNTITITGGSYSFEIPPQEVFTLTWNGEKWATLKYKLNDIFVQYPFQKPPYYFDNGTWEDVTDLYEGAYFRALGGNSEVWEVLQKEHLPNITGVGFRGYDEIGEYEGAIERGDSRGSFEGGASAFRKSSINASRMNYGTEENPRYIYTDDATKQHVNANNYGKRLWKKTAY